MVWIRAERQSGDELVLSHDLLGIRLKVSGDNLRLLKNRCAVKLRALNKAQYEPFLEENEERVFDIIQVYPKEFRFNPPATAWLSLPSCVSPQSSSQLVILYSSNLCVRNGVRHLKWTTLDSECFEVNSTGTEAKLIVNKTGVYTIKVTPHPQLTRQLHPLSARCDVMLTLPKLHVTFPTGCVTECTNVTLKVLRIADLYNCPSVCPVPLILRTRLTCDLESPTSCGSTELKMDITCGPVVLVRPTRCRFTKPIHLTVPLLGPEFDDLFVKEESRLVVLKSRVLNEKEVKWKHHYSTPEVINGVDGELLASFLLTRGGLYKVVRRFPEQYMHFAEHVARDISNQMCNSVSTSYFVTTKLRGLMTEIQEPGKQFVLRIALFDASQPVKPDGCFVSEVCSELLTIPLGEARFLVRGSFEPDRDAADHSEDRTVVFTGKTTFVDFYMKMRLNNPTKLPEVIGKVSVQAERNTQYHISLCKPTPIVPEQHFSKVKNSRPTLLVKRLKPLIKRQSMPAIQAVPGATEEQTNDVSSTQDSRSRHSLPTLHETRGSSTRGLDTPTTSVGLVGSANGDYRDDTWSSRAYSGSSEENRPTLQPRIVHGTT